MLPFQAVDNSYFTDKDISIWDMPYISDIALHKWSRCLFSLSMNMFSYFTALLIFIRYLHCKEMMASIGVNMEHLRRLVRINKGSLILGLFTCICLIGYCNFYTVFPNEGDQSHVIHLISMMVLYFFGFVYITLQTYFSHVTRPNFTTNLQYRMQLVMNAAVCLTMLASFILGLVAHESSVDMAAQLKLSEERYADVPTTTTPYTPTPIHRASAVFQWLTVLLLFAYYLCFVPVFRRIRIDFLLHTDTALSALAGNIPGANIQVRPPSHLTNNYNRM